MRLIVSLAGIAEMVAVLVPASALAGTYTWNMPGDPGLFTGSNPEQKYGAPSWTYSASGTLAFSGGTWSDAAGDSISASGGNVTMVASLGHAATVSWTNPTAQIATVTSTVTPGAPCLPGINLTGGGPSVLPGTTMTLTLKGLATGCTASGTITISATTPAPTPTLTSPANGASISDAQPTFSGSASSGFGVSGQVKVSVYSGSAASGTPLETVTTNVASGSYSASPNPAPASLDALCRRFAIDLSSRDRHGAAIDCGLLAAVYIELLGGRQPGLDFAANTATAADLIGAPRGLTREAP